MIESVKRWVATKINADGIRTLCCARQGRNTYATQKEAQDWIDAVRGNKYNVEVALGANPELAEPREVDCYPGHFDPMNCWFDRPDVNTILEHIKENNNG